MFGDVFFVSFASELFGGLLWFVCVFVGVGGFSPALSCGHATHLASCHDRQIGDMLWIVWGGMILCGMKPSVCSTKVLRYVNDVFICIFLLLVLAY